MSERQTTSGPLTGISHSARRALRMEKSIQSEITAISPFVDELMLFVRQCRCDPRSEMDIEICLREALANAVIHGNHEDPNKHVYVSCLCVPYEEISFVVRDEGKGYDSAEIPNPTAAERLEATHGRGVHLMKALMDEVRFEQGGTVVRMRKKFAMDDQRAVHLKSTQ
jgi:serine/threonine-protein kinase RsbW